MPLKRYLIILIVLLAACKQQPPQKVLLIEDDGFAELYGCIELYGNVKEISTGDDKNYYKGFFDENGELKYTMSRDVTVWIDKTGTHSETHAQKAEYTTTRDLSGNKTAIISKEYGTTNQIAKWEFDKSGKIIDRIDLSITDTTMSDYHCKSNLKYNDRNDLIEFDHDFCMKLEPFIYKYSYDDRHVLVKESVYEGEKLLFTNRFIYKDFDSRHNWTKRVAYWHSSLPTHSPDTTFTITRKITYY